MLLKNFSHVLIGSLKSALILLFSILASNRIEAQEIYQVVEGNRVELTSIVIDGPFELGLADRFQDYMENFHPDAPIIIFNSPGGNLYEGLKLGALIRSYGIDTGIGVAKPNDGYEKDVGTGLEFRYNLHIDENDGICASACAYAFLGGKFRSIPNDISLGFHQFYRNLNSNDFIDTMDGYQSGSSEAQSTSALIVEYLVMLEDIDPRLLRIASNTPPEEIYWISKLEATEFGIINEVGWSDFWLEPYKNGVVAASRRNDAVSGYENLYAYNILGQATFFCRYRKAYFMLSTPHQVKVSEEWSTASWNFFTNTDSNIPTFFDTSFRTRGSSDGGWIDMEIPPYIIDLIKVTNSFSVYFELPRYQGGDQFFDAELTEMDRSIIAYSLQNCIE